MQIKASLLDVVIPIVVAVNILVFILNIATVIRLDSLTETPQFVSQSDRTTSILAPSLNNTPDLEKYTLDQDAPGNGLLLDDTVTGSSLTDSRASRLGEANSRTSSKFDPRPVYFLYVPFQRRNTLASATFYDSLDIFLSSLSKFLVLYFKPVAKHLSLNSFRHIYKSGGTSFCATARGANKRVPPGLNCNLARGFSKRSASEQLEVLKRYEVAANEYDGLPKSDTLLMPRSHAAYVVFLRDPLDRLLSHFAAAQVLHTLQLF
jgi:hypothetical protein